jgi:hypothetical protein
MTVISKLSSESQLLELRLIVGFLGEKAQFDWWPTSFYEQSGRPFLEPVFSKTTNLAQYHAVVEAARRLHDEHLNAGAYHVFRLPEELEQTLHRLIITNTDASFSATSIGSKEEALSELHNMANGKNQDSVGPLAIGTVKKITSSLALEEIAAAYHSAFIGEHRCYPYFAS